MIIHTLKLPADAQIEWKIFKKSLDARHKPDIYYVYSVDVYNVIISGKNTALNDIIEGKIIKKQTAAVTHFLINRSPSVPSDIRPTKKSHDILSHGFIITYFLLLHNLFFARSTLLLKRLSRSFIIKWYITRSRAEARIHAIGLAIQVPK